LVGLPIMATAMFYTLPPEWQCHRVAQLAPQALTSLALVAWAVHNPEAWARLGLLPLRLGQGLRWGLTVGCVLGVINTMVILWGVPRLGFDIGFLRDTPHARAPVALMLPWLILLIAFAVELNFRGFLLGRLLALLEQRWPALPRPLASGLAVGITAWTFSFDPFMVVTFQYLHWIALWDGTVWGWLWIRMRNLAVPVIAHAVEVMIVYSVLRKALLA
jgi:hypothetical protein